jgi:acetyltransferase-like isoleucine patch superfamily enzyme
MKPVIFLGTGDNNLQMPQRICELMGIPIAGTLDSDYFGNTDTVCGIKIIGSELTFDFDREKDNYDFFVGQSAFRKDIRSWKKRMQLIELVEQKNLNCATLIHPNSEILDHTVVEPGCMIGFCVGIGHNSRIGKHTQLQSFSMIGHDVTIGQNCIILPHALILPCCKLGNHVAVGPGASILHTGSGTQIADYAEIQARVTVARNVDHGEIVSLAGDNTRRIYGTVIRS